MTENDRELASTVVRMQGRRNRLERGGKKVGGPNRGAVADMARRLIKIREGKVRRRPENESVLNVGDPLVKSGSENAGRIDVAWGTRTPRRRDVIMRHDDDVHAIKDPLRAGWQHA